MAPSSPITIVIKGNPETGTPGDCPFCHRVLLTLAQKGIPYSLELVDFANKPQWLLDASGGKVPVMKVPAEDLVLPDSDRIAVWLEERFPSPSLKSDAPETLASKVFPAFRQYLQSSPEEAEAKKAVLLVELEVVNAYLAAAGKGPLFGGTKMDAVDAAFAPKLYHINVALPHYKGFEMPLQLSALWRYLAFVQTLPAWQKVDYGSECIVEGWGKHH